MGKPRLICFDAPVSRGEECRLACDCSKVEITEDEQGEPLDVGRKTRSISPAFRRALVARDKGAWRFFNARGESLHGCAPGHTQPLADWRQVPAEHAARGLHIDANTAATGWCGERMNYGVAIDSLRFRTAADKREERGGAT